MEIQFGKNPGITLSCCWNVHSYLGHLSLPFAIEWWHNDCITGVVTDIAIWFLGIRFGLEIWKWRKEND